MISNRSIISRRNLLHAAGVTIALPALESAGARPRQGKVMRMVCMSSGLGVNPEAFFPDEFGAGAALSPTLKPLEPLRGDFTVFSHMDHPGIFTKHGSMNSVFSGVDAKKASPGENVSVDQVAAEHVGYQTRFPSMHISLGGGHGASWTSSGMKVREDGSPQQLFAKMFVNDSPQAKLRHAQRLEQQTSILDVVRQQAQRLEKSVNASDRRKLDEYQTAIREAEHQIAGMQRWQSIAKPDLNKKGIDFDSHGTMDYATLGPLMFDMLYLAIRSDSSRVFTACYGMHNKIIELDGVKSGYHGLSHHGRVEQRLEELRIIDKFYIEQMARFMAKLKDTPSETGNLLDETMLFFGSGLGDASRHSNRDLPVVIGGGGFKHAGHVDAMLPGKRQTPLNNLFTTMLQNFGVPIDRFNNATGTVTL